MKQPRDAGKARPQGRAQTEPTASREKVREISRPVRAARQSQRPVERNPKAS
jgi:hypothetical protein